MDRQSTSHGDTKAFALLPVLAFAAVLAAGARNFAVAIPIVIVLVLAAAWLRTRRNACSRMDILLAVVPVVGIAVIAAQFYELPALTPFAAAVSVALAAWRPAHRAEHDEKKEHRG